MQEIAEPYSEIIARLDSIPGIDITAALLILSSILSKHQIETEGVSNTVSPLKGFLIGIAQGIGTLPGISRSGITISASLMAGVDRKTAGEFSFILSIPATTICIGVKVLDFKIFPSFSVNTIVPVLETRKFAPVTKASG